MIQLISLAASAWILVAYAIMIRSGRQRPFHWANALGCFPLLAASAAAGVWGPFALTAVFGVAGWIGLWTTRDRTPVVGIPQHQPMPANRPTPSWD